MSRSTAVLTLRGNRTVLVDAVEVLLRSTIPEVTIRRSTGHKVSAHDGVDIECSQAGRWMCLLSSTRDVETAREALEKGAWCIGTLEDTPEQFESCLRALLNGTSTYLPIAFARLIAAQAPTGDNANHSKPANTFPPDHTPLTAREREVLAFVAQGLSNTEIAETMGISVHTVRTHLSSMATKIDANNRLRMVAKATMLGYPEASGSLGGR